MLTYESDGTFTHRLDPWTKLAVQVASMAVSFVYATPIGLVALGVVAVGYLHAADALPVSAPCNLRYAIPLLAFDSTVEAARLDAPWSNLEAVAEPALASVCALLVFFTVAAYARMTPIRESHTAIQLLVPGRLDVTLGVGVALVLRFSPLVRRDLRCIREMQAVCLGSERWLDERLPLVAAAGLQRSFARANALAFVLRARCFAWNPTLPEIRFGRRDVPGFILTATFLVNLAL